MKNILNLYKYKVDFDRVDGIDVRINFDCGLEDHPTSSIDIMNLCLGLNKEFDISKIDMYTDEYNEDITFYIIVNIELGYKILKYFLDNTNDLDRIEKINKQYMINCERFYGKTYFSDYIKEYENKLSDYENLVNKQVTLDIFNLYTKKVEWYLDEKERICITIAQNNCKALHIANDGFNVLDICKELENKFHVSNIGLINKYNILNIGLTCGDSDAKLAFVIEDANIGYKLLKTFLDNTDESLLDDRYLITNKDNVLRMREIIACYKLMLDSYKSKFCKENIVYIE